MSVIQVGDLQLQETVGSQITVGEFGIASATVEYIGKGNDGINAAVNMTAHPVFSYLKRKNIRVVSEEGGIVKVSATFEGVPPQGVGGGGNTNNASTPKYSIKTSLTSQPIQSHMHFDIFATDTRTGAKFEATGVDKDKFIGFMDKTTPIGRMFYGVKSYESPTVVFQETILFESAKSAVLTDLSKIGQIDSPPSVVNGLISVPAGSNWLLIGADAEQVGFGYRVTKQWKLSARGGWNPFIYGYSNI